MLSVVIVANGCTYTPESHSHLENLSLNGAWSYVFNDSIYGEVIFINNRLWEHHSDIGEYERKYRIDNDSLTIVNPQGYAELKVKLLVISRDNFITISEDTKTSYLRILASQDLEKVTERTDPEYSDYMDGFEKRYLDFKNSKRTKIEK